MIVSESVIIIIQSEMGDDDNYCKVARVNIRRTFAQKFFELQELID